jgi:hypothetical protein
MNDTYECWTEPIVQLGLKLRIERPVEGIFSFKTMDGDKVIHEIKVTDFRVRDIIKYLSSQMD